MRRPAEGVRDSLAARGLPRSGMTVEALGQDHLPVATADGIREPLNRYVRVEEARTRPRSGGASRKAKRVRYDGLLKGDSHE